MKRTVGRTRVTKKIKAPQKPIKNKKSQISKKETSQTYSRSIAQTNQKRDHLEEEIENSSETNLKEEEKIENSRETNLKKEDIAEKKQIMVPEVKIKKKLKMKKNQFQAVVLFHIKKKY